MAEAGKIIPFLTHIEIDEQGKIWLIQNHLEAAFTSVETDPQGKIWLIQNHLESDSVIMEMESTARGAVIYDDLSYLANDFYYDPFEEDYL